MNLSQKVIEAIVAHETRAQEHGRSGKNAEKLERTRQRLVSAIEEELRDARTNTVLELFSGLRKVES